MTLQALYGTIPQIYGKGECARVSMEQAGLVLYLNWYSAVVWWIISCIANNKILCLFSARRQHDAEDEEGVCW